MRTLLELLELLLSHINNNSEVSIFSGFCSYIYISFKSENITREEEILLIDYFQYQASSTNFVSIHDLRKYNDSHEKPYCLFPKYWLFLPHNWDSRKKWLENEIKIIKKEFSDIH